MRARSLARPLPLTLGLMGALSLACMKPAEPAPTPYVPSYAYEAPTSEAGRGISIALVRPSLSNEATASIAMQYAKMRVLPPADGGEAAPLRALRAATGRAMFDYFMASGFTTSGPFQDVNVMTFPEKKQADLLLTVEFGILTDQPRPDIFQTSPGRVERVDSEGDCSVRGAISFVMWEPLSMQRMWSKTTEVPPSTFSCTFSADSAEAYDLMIFNAFNRTYESAFANTMRAVERYFSPEEVALVKAQAQELRERKVY